MQTALEHAHTTLPGCRAVGIVDRSSGAVLASAGDRSQLALATSRRVHRDLHRRVAELVPDRQPDGTRRTTWIERGAIEVCQPLPHAPEHALLVRCARDVPIGSVFAFASRLAADLRHARSARELRPRGWDEPGSGHRVARSR